MKNFSETAEALRPGACFLMGAYPVKPHPHSRMNASENLKLRNFWKNDPKKIEHMAKTVKDYVKQITKTLKTNKTYGKGLDMQILSLASAMRNLEMVIGAR